MTTKMTMTKQDILLNEAAVAELKMHMRGPVLRPGDEGRTSPTSGRFWYAMLLEKVSERSIAIRKHVLCLYGRCGVLSTFFHGWGKG